MKQSDRTAIAEHAPDYRPPDQGAKSAKRELAISAAEMIERSRREKFSLDRLANELHVNKYYLSRTFKEVWGQTLLNYHHFCRCEGSKEYLEKSELSVEMIAFETGYMTSSHYIRTFHKIFGMTPLQYRRDYESKENI